MEKKIYTERRAEMIGRIYAMKFRQHFPRTVKARLRLIARLDAEYKGTDFDSEYMTILEQFGLQR